jgi:hypothetical protein
VIVRFVGCGRFRVNIFAIARPASSRRRLSLCATAAVVVIAANLVAFRDLNVTDATAARLRRHQTATSAQVRTRDGQLVATVTAVNATAASLSTRNEERDRARQSLAVTVARLVAERVDLGAAFGRLAAQSAQITTLTTCLQGVSQAMNGLSVGDTARGVQALHAVEGPCRRAATVGAGG